MAMKICFVSGDITNESRVGAKTPTFSSFASSIRTSYGEIAHNIAFWMNQMYIDVILLSLRAIFCPVVVGWDGVPALSGGDFTSEYIEYIRLRPTSQTRAMATRSCLAQPPSALRATSPKYPPKNGGVFRGRKAEARKIFEMRFCIFCNDQTMFRLEMRGGSWERATCLRCDRSKDVRVR
jgi:hypothetical protein